MNSEVVNYVEIVRGILLGGSVVALAVNLFCASVIALSVGKIREGYDRAVGKMLGKISTAELVPLGLLAVYFALRYASNDTSPPDHVLQYLLIVSTYMVSLVGLMAPGICGLMLVTKARER